jgi:PhoPQ-activated pathogenicity-related protein
MQLMGSLQYRLLLNLAFDALVFAQSAVAQTTADLPDLQNAPIDTVVNKDKTALDEYVAKEDKSFVWKIVSQPADAAGNLSLVIEFTSQTWQPAESVSRSEWQHVMQVFIPASAKSDTGLLIISGGDNDDPVPTEIDDRTRQIAAATQSVVATLNCVPNQPLSFGGESRVRYEDAIIAYTWDKFLDSEDDNWPLQLPMVKSAVRAMDVLTAVTQSLGSPVVPVDKFVVTGASKRGWTTWLTAAADPRVVAIAPIVIDMLNMDPSMVHHYECYGEWSKALDDYIEAEIPQRRLLPRYRELVQIADPAAYRDRLSMPKCIINSAGDEFFLPDSSQFYFDDLVGEKYLAYFPNCGHALRGSNALDTLIAFYTTVIHNTPRPHVEWSRPEANVLVVTADRPPRRVLLWEGLNPKTRDFRLPVAGECYESRELQSDDSNVWRVELPIPAEGWTASFVQLEFDVGATRPFRVSTPVIVLPETRPFVGKPLEE